MLKLNVFIQPRLVLHHSGVSPTHLLIQHPGSWRECVGEDHDKAVSCFSLSLLALYCQLKVMLGLNSFQ